MKISKVLREQPAPGLLGSVCISGCVSSIPLGTRLHLLSLGTMAAQHMGSWDSALTLLQNYNPSCYCFGLQGSWDDYNLSKLGNENDTKMSIPKTQGASLDAPRESWHSAQTQSCNYSLSPAQCLTKRNFHQPKTFLVSKKAPFHPQNYPQKQTDKSSFLVK